MPADIKARPLSMKAAMRRANRRDRGALEEILDGREKYG